MDLLPKSSSEFSQQDYWNKFFKSRGKNAFEWYGTYPQLCGVLHKYMSPRDSILVGGCGNSALSADLYSAGFKSITNVDISETVIQQMKNQYAESHPDMTFEKMDLLNMSYSEGSFSCFLDKGTLDALMSGNDEESRERALKMFREIERVLKLGGRYICVSLLQEHISQCLLSHFHQLGWMIRVCRCEEAEGTREEELKGKSKKAVERFPFPVFAVICTKFKKMDRIAPIVEFCSNEASTARLPDLQSLKDQIKSIQQFALLCHQMTVNSKSSEDVFIELMDPKSQKSAPKYTLFVVDHQRKTANKFAAFVVPQGREAEWLFNSNDGRRQLAENANFQRLVIIHLGRDHQFGSLQCVQDELASVVSSLQPKDLAANSKIPFLSLGSDVNQRREVHRGFSECSGHFVVEEVDEDPSKKTVLRRLIFLCSPNVIQSEARIIKGKVDLKYLSCQHHLTMVETLRDFVKVHRKVTNVLVLGLGGGALCTYLHQQFPALCIDGVDIDPAMVDLAKKYFGFNQSANLKARIADGVQFVRDTAATGDRYGCVMIDVDCKDRTLGMSCPPPSFVEASFLHALNKCLCDEGLLVLNLVCRDQSRQKDTVDLLQQTFCNVKVTRIKDEVNVIVAGYKTAVKAASD